MPLSAASPAHKMHVVPLGINLEGLRSRPAHSASNCFTVGYFARIAPEKGLHVLAETYIQLRRETRILRRHAGSRPAISRPSIATTCAASRSKMKDAGFAHEFRYRGVLDRTHKIDFLRNLDVLCVPSTYDEPKGLFLLEAMANGVPVVQPRRGAFPEIAAARPAAAFWWNPTIAASLAEGILSLWKDRALAAELGRRGAQGVREHYSVARMAARALDVYSRVAAARVHA